jgi:hypothetical protein
MSVFQQPARVIDADGHIIECNDELRRYLKAPFNKRKEIL